MYMNPSDTTAFCKHCQLPTKNILYTTCLKDNDITITMSVAKKKYKLTDDELSELTKQSETGKITIIKRRCYKSDVEDYVKTLENQRQERKQEKKKMLAEQETKRRDIIINYLKTQASGYLTFVNCQCDDVLKMYYQGKINDEEVIQIMEGKYKKFLDKIQMQKQRKEDLQSVIDKHEMKNYKLYQEKLKDRIYQYIDDEDLTLVGHFLTIQEEYTRIKELYDKFEAAGLEPRMDSFLCKMYVKHGLESILGETKDMGIITCVDDIIDIMIALNFLHKKTNYSSQLTYLHNNSRHYRDDNYDFTKMARKSALKAWLTKGGKREEIPKRLHKYV